MQIGESESTHGLFEVMPIRTRVIMSSGLWYEDGISSNSEEDRNVVGEEAGDRGDMRVESTGMSVRKDVWGTRAPAG